jgi:hypothetical protein
LSGSRVPLSRVFCRRRVARPVGRAFRNLARYRGLLPWCGYPSFARLPLAPPRPGFSNIQDRSSLFSVWLATVGYVISCNACRRRARSLRCADCAVSNEAKNVSRQLCRARVSPIGAHKLIDDLALQQNMRSPEDLMRKIVSFLSPGRKAAVGQANTLF